MKKKRRRDQLRAHLREEEKKRSRTREQVRKGCQPSLCKVSQKYHLIYMITKLGLLFVYDLETAAAVYIDRKSPDPIFLTSEASSVGGFYAINRRGQVLLTTVNEATIVPFVSSQ